MSVTSNGHATGSTSSDGISTPANTSAANSVPTSAPTSAPTSDNAGAIERMRLAALDDLHLLDTPPEERFDRITRLAREIFNVPVAEINLISDFQQFTKSPQPAGVTVHANREDSFCEVTIQGPDILVVPDATKDSRFSYRAPTTGARHIRFYAGRPLSLGDELRVGTLCLVDTKPREMDAVQQQLLNEMGLWVERELRDSAQPDGPEGSAAAAASPGAEATITGLVAEPDDDRLAFEVAGASLPLRKVGTDFFSSTTLDGNIEFMVADVMGKGVAAAATAASIRDAFEQQDDQDIAARMQEVNSRLSYVLRESGTFATLVLARLEESTGVLDYVDAGHGLTLIVRQDNGVERLETSGFPLGLIPTGTWTIRSTLLQPGDILVSFTDGVLNLFDGTLASLDKVVELVRASSGPQDVIKRVVDLNRRGASRDDLTIVAVACTTAAAAAPSVAAASAASAATGVSAASAVRKGRAAR